MKVKVKCNQCKKTFRITAGSMKDAKKFKRTVSCTCMKCMSLGGVDLVKVYGNTVMLCW